MRARTLPLLICLLALAPFAGAQTVEVLKTAQQQLPPATDFAFIEPKTDPAGYTFVSTYKVTGKGESARITNLFLLISERALQDGATCFKLGSFERNSAREEATLVLDTYYWNDSVRLENFNNHEQDCIYIFGGEAPDEDNSMHFKINNEKKTLKSGTWYRHQRKEGEEVKINVGGITGMTVWYTLHGHKPNLFLTLTGLGVGGAPASSNVVGLSVNTGRIRQVPGDLGCLLVRLLKPGN